MRVKIPTKTSLALCFHCFGYQKHWLEYRANFVTSFGCSILRLWRDEGTLHFHISILGEFLIMTGLWFDACRRLDSNALVCDCEMVWLVQTLQDKLKGTQAAATCQYPIAMQGKSLTAMTETDFHCSEYHRNTEAPASCNVFAVTCLPLT